MEVLALTLIPHLEKAGNILLAALGLGLVIFIHELGHFAVAKWCNVKVERFSIGFGPILWRYKRGETEYALSAIPFGGYVKMLGQDDADPNQMADATVARDPRSYTAKSVPQRMAIISAGVINNMVSAVLFFIVAFLFGVQYQPAVVGQVTPGMPAWEAGLRLGDQITRVGTRNYEKLGFIDVRQAVALSKANEPVEIEGLRNGKPFKTSVSPMTKGQFYPTIFVEPEQGLMLHDATDTKTGTLTTPGLSAAAAEPPFQPGDRIRDVDGVELKGYADLQTILSAKRSQAVELGVARKGDAPETPRTRIHVGPNHFRTLGIHMAIGEISAIQRGSPSDSKLQVGDTITHITADEKTVAIGTEIDPLQLPDFLASLAGKEVKLTVKRKAVEGERRPESVDLVPENRDGWIERPGMIEDCPLSVPAIGVAFHVTHHVVYVKPGGPADRAGIKAGVNLQQMELVIPEGEPGSTREGDARDVKIEPVKFDAELRNWPQAFWLMQQFPDRIVKLTVTPQGGEKSAPVVVTPIADSDWYLPMRGFALQPLYEVRQAENIGQAVSLGFRHTRDSMVDMWFTIRNLFSGRISAKALGGPIRIAETAYHFSKQGFPDLILFLGFLSVNLAVLNIMPIPVLDGGHFVFLCWEGIRGKPPSERIVVTATYVGLALVLSLMAWVMYLDISSHI